METKQLELFKETDFNEMKTFIKEHDGWYLFDDIRDRKDFSRKISNKYMAVCKTGESFDIYDSNSIIACIIESDRKAKLIGMNDYLKLACSMRLNGNYIYNKKKCKLELKNNQIGKTLQII